MKRARSLPSIVIVVLAILNQAVRADGATPTPASQPARQPASTATQPEVTSGFPTVKTYQLGKIDPVTFREEADKLRPFGVLSCDENTLGRPGERLTRMQVRATPAGHERVRELLERIRSETSPEETRVVVFPLKNVSVDAAVQSINSLSSSGVRVVSDKATGGLIVCGTREEIAQVESILAAIDVANEGTRRETRIMDLRSIRPADMCEVVKSLDGSPRCTTLAGSRSILVTAPTESFSAIENVVYKLDDQAALPRPDRKLQIIRLARPITQSIQEAVQLELSEGAKIAIDEASNSLVVSASESDIKAVNDVLQGLGLFKPLPSDLPSMKLRLVWLTAPRTKSKSATSRPEGAQTPDDLKPVIDELAAIGIRDLSLQAQMTVAIEDSEFKLTAVPNVTIGDEQHVSGLDVEGKLLTADGEAVPRVSLSISIQITGRVAASSQLETTVRAPLNHPIALANAPVGDLDSVLIIELLQGARPAAGVTPPVR